MSQWSAWQDQFFDGTSPYSGSFQYPHGCDVYVDYESHQPDPRYWVGDPQYRYQYMKERPWQARQPSPSEAFVSPTCYWDDNSSCASSHAFETRSPPVTFMHTPIGWEQAGVDYLHPWFTSTGVNPSKILQEGDAFWDEVQHASPTDPIELDTKAERYSIEDLVIESPHETSQVLPHDPPALTPHTRSSFSSSDSESEYEPPSHTRHRTHTRQHAHARVRKSQTHKVTKARQAKKGDKIAAAQRHTKSSSSTSSDESKEEKSRHFSCPLRPYGCQATFATKNEWKRHFMSHLLLDYFRCDLCQNSVENPNDFNRKDLFLQHLRRMHGNGFVAVPRSKKVEPKGLTKGSLSSSLSSVSLTASSMSDQDVCSRCYVPVHDPPTQTSCVLCSETFTGTQSCREWLEHVGRHLAQMGKGKSNMVTVPWDMDKSLRTWLLAVGIIVPTEAEGVWHLTDNTYDIKAHAFARKASIADGK